MPKEITFYVILGEKRDPSEICANPNLCNRTHITEKPSYVYTFSPTRSKKSQPKLLDGERKSCVGRISLVRFLEMKKRCIGRTSVVRRLTIGPTGHSTIPPGIRTRNLLITTTTPTLLQTGLKPTTFCSKDRCSAIEPLKYFSD